ncbi:MAG: DUF3768 domain-containing protein [Pseudolabrys sp.]
MTTSQANRIRALNDDLRQHLIGGGAVITLGVAALGQETVDRIVQMVAVFDDFCHVNDPYEEHDFGSFEVEGETIFFKIDYFDRTLTHHSPDPANPAVTERVITIMLANEY